MALALGACTTLAPDGQVSGPVGPDAVGPGGPAASTPAPVAANPAGQADPAADATQPPAEIIARSSGRVISLPGSEAAERGDLEAAEAATLEIERPPQPAIPDRDLWQRIRDGFAFPDLPTPLVDQKRRFYLQRPEYLQRMFARGSRYLYHIVEEVERRGMPTELALLPFVESAMNPVALSHAKAAGLWQFIPATGRRYDLEQNWWADNRRDVVRSTDAALQYLQTIYEMHGNDWFLALASYNWGEGAVGRAIRTNRARGQPTDYLSLRMPTETRHYVPKLIALKQIIADADAFGVKLPPLADEPYFVMVKKTRPIDLKLAAQFANMTVEEFVALNPAHHRPVIAATENSMLKIPADRLDGFIEAMARHEADEKVFATWFPYTLKRGETLEDVARRGGVTAAELRRANTIAPEVKVLAGTRLLAPQKSVGDDASLAGFAGARIYQQINVPARYHVVRRNDTPARIARRHGLTIRQLAAFNGGRTQYRAGQRLVIRHAQVQTVLINEQGTRRLISSEAAGRAAAGSGASAGSGTAAASGAEAAAAAAATSAAATATRPAPARPRANQAPTRATSRTARSATATPAATRTAAAKAATGKAAATPNREANSKRATPPRGAATQTRNRSNGKEANAGRSSTAAATASARSETAVR